MTSLADPVSLLHALAPVVEQNLERHLGVAKEWMPHDYVPWSEGRNFAFLGGEEWSVEQSTLSPMARTALELNLLTEDNLPSYHREIERAFGREGPWGEWVHRWTAEEGRHSIAIRDYLVVTRSVDPVELERARMQVMSTGYDSGDKPVMHAIAYVSFQELATRVSHRNTGRFAADPVAEKLLARVSTDENLHMIFYRNLLKAALEIAPDLAMQAIRDEIVDFAMPGAVVPGYRRKAAMIAKAGIYDLQLHRDEIVEPLLRYWGVWDLETLGPDGEQARDQLAAFLKTLDADANRFVAAREAAAAKVAARAQG